jgi:hypothetical protein
MRYLPGLFSMFTAILLFRYAPAKRKVESLVVATGFGLCAMEAGGVLDCTWISPSGNTVLLSLLWRSPY